MTLIIDWAADEVRDKGDGTVVGTITGAPYRNSDYAQQAVRDQLADTLTNITAQDINWILDAASGDVEWADPER